MQDSLMTYYMGVNKMSNLSDTLKLEWKIHQIYIRAEQIARETRIRLGDEHECHGFNIQCDCEMPEFQETLHPAHNFNLWLQQQRLRYE